VDDCWASFGSANLDNRSMSLNEEVNLNVLDRQFVTSHAKVFDEDKNHAHQVTLQDWRHRPWEEKIKGRAMSIFRSQM
jgi:cardiolipin synthase